MSDYRHHPAEPPSPQTAPRPTAAPRPRRGTKLVTIAAVAAAVVGGTSGAAIGALSTTSAAPPTAEQSAATGHQVSAGTSSGDVSAVVQRVLPSVVQVTARTEDGEALGSGVILDEGGRILTNAHVVAGATGQVAITLADGRQYQASVLKSDDKADIAVLQAAGATGLTPATLGDSDDVEVGAPVIAIGSPGGLQNTVTTGIVSAVDRQLGDTNRQDPTASAAGNAQAPSYTAIQTDAAINHGNSGGPLVNASGEVIGINSAIYSPSAQSGSVGIGFAIPVNDVRAVVGQVD